MIYSLDGAWSPCVANVRGVDYGRLIGSGKNVIKPPTDSNRWQPIANNN